MVRYRRLRRVCLAAATAGLLAGCAGIMVGRPTPVPSGRRLDVPQPTATQIAVGANPNPSAPRMNPLVAQVKPPGARVAANPYAWLENIHSNRTRHWIDVEDREATKALAALPRRAWIRTRLAQFQDGKRSQRCRRGARLLSDPGWRPAADADRVSARSGPRRQSADTTHRISAPRQARGAAARAFRVGVVGNGRRVCARRGAQRAGPSAGPAGGASAAARQVPRAQ